MFRKAPRIVGSVTGACTPPYPGRNSRRPLPGGSAASGVPYWHAHVDKCSILSYDLSAVLYLNTSGSGGFDGGAFAFLDPDGADRLVWPRAGRLLAFTSGVENVHQVRRVAHGARYAIAMWFTLSAEHRQDERELEVGRVS